MVSIDNIHLSYGDKEILKGISLDIEQGEVIALIGPSGSGKTSLLRCLNALSMPSKGRVTINDNTVDFGKKVHKSDLTALRQHTGMVFQAFHLFPHMTALQNIREGLLTVKKLNKGEAEKIALELLEKVGLADKKDSYKSQLSGGQQQRIAIARALAMDPKVILFDEPTSALDIELVNEVLKVIKELSLEGMTMLIVTHEIKFASEIADRMIFMDDGQIIEQGDPKKLLNTPTHQRLKQFLSLIEA